MRPLISILSALVAATVLWLAPPVVADKRGDSEQKFRAGQTAFEIGDYVTAAQAFEESYALLPLPAIRFSVAQAHRLQYYKDKMPWRAAVAAGLYRLYVEEVKTGARVPDATQWLGELEPLVAVMTPSQRARPTEEKVTKVVVYATAPGAKIKWDEQISDSPFAAVVKPGTYTAEVSAPGFFPQTLQVVALDGVLTDKEVVLRAMPARVKVPMASGLVVKVDGRRVDAQRGTVLVPEGKHVVSLSRRGRVPRLAEMTFVRDESVDLSKSLAVSSQRKWAKGLYWTSGVLAVGAGVAAAFALHHDNKADELLQGSAQDGISLEQAADYQHHRQRRDDFRMWSIVGGGAAVATAGLATLLYLSDHKQAEIPPSSAIPSVVPFVNDDLVGVSWTGRY